MLHGNALFILMARFCALRKMIGKLRSAASAGDSVADSVDVDQNVPRSAEYLVVTVGRRINYEARVLNVFFRGVIGFSRRQRAAFR
jgi:hypothetical protein